jgi:hypothetical protein
MRRSKGLNIQELEIAAVMNYPLQYSGGGDSKLSAAQALRLVRAVWTKFHNANRSGWRCKEIDKLRKTKLMKLIS